MDGYGRRGPVPWRELIQLAGVPPSYGELRSPGEWHGLPVDRWLRIVYLIDDVGPVIRWLDPKGGQTESRLGGCLHDHLENGDSHNSARSGWLVRRSDGTIEIQ